MTHGLCQGRPHGRRDASSRTRRSTRILVEHGRAAGVMTDKGEIRAEDRRDLRRHVVARPGGRRSASPCRCMRPSISTSSPNPSPACRATCRCCSSATSGPTTRRTRASCWSGSSNPNAKPWGQTGIPDDFCFDTLPEDFDHIAADPGGGHSTACRCSQRTGIQLFFNGPESFTPDDRYLLGETPEVQGLFCATRLQLDRHPVLGWRRQGAGRLDPRRPPAGRTDGRRRAPDAGVSRATASLSRGPHDRDARPAVRHALALPAVRHRPRRPAQPVPRPADGARRLHDGGGGLGASRLLRRAGHDARDRLFLRPPELVRRLRRGVPQHAQTT